MPAADIALWLADAARHARRHILRLAFACIRTVKTAVWR